MTGRAPFHLTPSQSRNPMEAIMTKTEKTKASETSSNDIRMIPLCKLKKSPRNARKTPHTPSEIEALAASIKAHGMIQNPVVEPEFKRKKATGYYLVTAGE